MRRILSRNRSPPSSEPPSPESVCNAITSSARSINPNDGGGPPARFGSRLAQRLRTRSDSSQDDAKSTGDNSTSRRASPPGAPRTAASTFVPLPPRGAPKFNASNNAPLHIATDQPKSQNVVTPPSDESRSSIATPLRQQPSSDADMNHPSKFTFNEPSVATEHYHTLQNKDGNPPQAQDYPSLSISQQIHRPRVLDQSPHFGVSQTKSDVSLSPVPSFGNTPISPNCSFGSPIKHSKNQSPVVSPTRAPIPPIVLELRQQLNDKKIELVRLVKKKNSQDQTIHALRRKLAQLHMQSKDTAYESGKTMIGLHHSADERGRPMVLSPTGSSAQRHDQYMSVALRLEEEFKVIHDDFLRRGLSPPVIPVFASPAKLRLHQSKSNNGFSDVSLDNENEHTILQPLGLLETDPVIVASPSGELHDLASPVGSPTPHLRPKAHEKNLVWVDAVQVGFLKKHALDNRLVITRIEKQISYLKQICEQIIASLREELAEVARSHHLTGGEMHNQLKVLDEARANVEEHLKTNVICKEEIAKRLSEEVEAKKLTNKILKDSVTELETHKAQLEMDLMNQLTMLTREHEESEERYVTDLARKKSRIATLEQEMRRLQVEYLKSGLVLDPTHLRRLISVEQSFSYGMSSFDQQEESPRKGAFDSNDTRAYQWNQVFAQLKAATQMLSILQEFPDQIDSIQIAVAGILAELSSSSLQDATLNSHGDALTDMSRSLRFDSELRNLAIKAIRHDIQASLVERRQKVTKGIVCDDTASSNQVSLIKEPVSPIDACKHTRGPKPDLSSAQRSSIGTPIRSPKSWKSLQRMETPTGVIKPPSEDEWTRAMNSCTVHAEKKFKFYKQE